MPNPLTGVLTRKIKLRQTHREKNHVKTLGEKEEDHL